MREIIHDISLRDEQYTTLCLVTSKTFAKNIKEIIDCKKNVYGIKKEIERLDAIISLISKGIAEENVLDLVKSNRELIYAFLSKNY